MTKVQTSSTAKSVNDWKTGAEPMTSRQRWFLTNLAEKAGVPLKDDLTKVQASQLIEELQSKAAKG